MGKPTDYENGIVRINKGQTISRQAFLHSLVNSLYNRTTLEFNRGTFRVKGDTVDINLPYVDYGYRITFFGDEIEEIESIDVVTSKRIGLMSDAAIFPANLMWRPKIFCNRCCMKCRMKWQHRQNILKLSRSILKHSG